ncbi:FecR domain-containing protein [Chitinophaga sp. MM2321]|uniref:FecR family protein n=1 Tax=Chitinophaga sp. MM2321 TaxID=3137178 RepID=UPI0032D56790
MTEKSERISELIFRFLNEELLPAEAQELEEWLQADLQNRQYFLSLVEPDSLREGIQQAYTLESSRISVQERILKTIAEEAVPKRIPVRRMVFHPYGWWAAAAVIAVLLSVGLFFWPQRTHIPQQGQSHVPVADVLPASNKAVLTLADGATVTLDSTGQQVIRQGNTAIRQNNGQLEYAPQGGEAVVSYNVLTTPRGGQFAITLPDGSKVWLNSASSLRYPTAFKGKDRVVELKGQGYFEIAANASQPFIVKIPGRQNLQGEVHDLEVQVLGTSFDIMAYPDETAVNTTLLDGAVKVRKGAVAQVLQPGQQAVLNDKDTNIAVSLVDVSKVVAWKNGFFVFNNMNLPAILREISRWYDVEIVYNAPPNGRLYGGGISRKKSLSGILRFLEAGGTNHFRIEGRQVIVMP